MRGRVATTAGLAAGISFNSAEIDEDYREVFGPGTRLDVDMDNSFAVRRSWS